MKPDLKDLKAEVKQTEETLRDFQRGLLRQAKRAEGKGKARPADFDVALDLCEAARAQARKHGRAPFDPPALKRHEGLEKVAEAAGDARQKKGAMA